MKTLGMALVTTLALCSVSMADWYVGPTRTVTAYYAAPVLEPVATPATYTTYYAPTAVYSPVVAATPVVDAPVYTTYYAPRAVYRPVPRVAYMTVAPAPYVTYSPVVAAPVVVGRPAVVRTKVYYPFQPVRNTVRAILP